MKLCPICHAMYSPDDVFCPNDGSALMVSGRPADIPAASYATPSPENQFLQPHPNGYAAPVRSVIQPIHVIIGVLSLIVLALSGILLANLLPGRATVVQNDKQKGERTTGSVQEPNPAPTSIVNTPQKSAPSAYTGTNSGSIGMPARLPNVSPRGHWTGDWSSPSGAYLTIAVDLNDDGSGRVGGQIQWTLRQTTRPEKMNKIGLSATEFVSGNFDPATKTLTLKGYRKDDPNNVLVMVDSYRLTMSGDSNRMGGNARNGGKWNASIKLAR